VNVQDIRCPWPPLVPGWWTSIFHCLGDKVQPSQVHGCWSTASHSALVMGYNFPRGRGHRQSESKVPRGTHRLGHREWAQDPQITQDCGRLRTHPWPSQAPDDGGTAGSARAGGTSLTQHVSRVCASSSQLPGQCLPCVPTSNIPQASSKEASLSRSPARVSMGLQAAKPLSRGRGAGRGLPALFGFLFPAWNLRRRLAVEAPLFWGGTKPLHSRVGGAAHGARTSAVH
jgi:hypothetical protein